MVACLSMRKRKGAEERKRVYADESASKSTLINFENRQVLVGDMQQKACWMVCASARKGNNKHSGHPFRPLPRYISQWASHPSCTRCISWPMFFMTKVHLLFPWVVFYTYGWKNEYHNIQHSHDSWSGEKRLVNMRHAHLPPTIQSRTGL